MPYIPEKHKQYNVLPYKREHGGEVFEYDSQLIRKLDDIVGEATDPYGFESYKAYFHYLNSFIKKYPEA